MRKITIISLLIILLNTLPVYSFDIIGVGKTPNAALSDGIKQISMVFGRHTIDSRTSVHNYVLKEDIIRARARFSGSKLERFLVGVYRQGGGYRAVFRFPDEFIEALQEKVRDKRQEALALSWDKVRYNSTEHDSFGEVHSKAWLFTVPACVRKFVDYYVWDVDGAGVVRWEVRN